MRCSAVSMVCVLLALCGLMACAGNGRPKGVLSLKEMENVMHDYHLAQAMDQMAEHNDSAAIGAIDKVLEKYNLTQADLDSSMSYYAFHIDDLKDIYERLGKRYADEAAELGIHRITPGATFSESGDTADVWMDARLVALSVAPLARMMEFSVDADSSYHQRDRFQLEGFSHFIGRPGEDMNNSISMGITVVYVNDTVQSTTRAVNGNQHFTLDLHCDSLYDIKSVYGYISISGKSSSPAILENLRMLKIHRSYLLKPKEEEKEEKSDTVQAQSQAIER